MDTRREVGQGGEDRAAAYLKSKGYKILERNWRSTAGELDIIASRKGVLVFIEVRTLESPHFGFPEESVGPHKQRQLARLATAYIQKVKHTGDWQIDVIAIDRGGLRHVENAVSLW